MSLSLTQKTYNIKSFHSTEQFGFITLQLHSSLICCTKTFTLFTDEGEIYITPNQERIIAKRGRNVESYQIDSRQLEFTVSTDDGPISSHALSNAYFVFSIKQKTGSSKVVHFQSLFNTMSFSKLPKLCITR